MISLADEYTVLVAEEGDPAARLRILLVLLEQAMQTPRVDSATVRELFGIVRALVDRLASQAAGASPTQSDT